MTWIATIDESGFLISTFNGDEFFVGPNPIPAPESESEPGYIWRRVNDSWVQVADRRGQLFYDPSNPDTEAYTITSILNDDPPSGWILYDDYKREIDGRKVLWKDIKQRRNSLLLASDWTQLPDVPIATKEAWATYRQQLRDITDQPDPFNVVWPTPPA